MKAFDFEYDGLRLSDKGFIICKFDSSGVDTISNGSEITFNTVSTMNGQKHELTSSEYGDCITATFQICKDYCTYDQNEISLDDMRDIMRWLNRKNFHKFRLLDDEYRNVYFDASFNVSKVEINGKVYGFELEMFTNRPFGFREPVKINMPNLQVDKPKTIFSQSDEEGYIYPDMEITIESDGDLEIRNSMENRVMRILNCKAGEVITVNYPLLSSSFGDGRETKLQNDFNWVYFRIATMFKNKLNNMTVSLPCSIKMKYTPIVKVGI